MRDDDALPISTPTSSSIVSSSSSGIPKQDHPLSSVGVFGRGRYKFWALAAIILLALWSMVTGTVSLRWSAGNLNHVADDYHFPSTDDLDVLDLEEREKMVKRMWDEYTNSQRIRLAGFWQEAFVAAYEDLTSEVPEVRHAAVSEIARMSALYIKLDPPPPLESSTSLNEITFCHLKCPKSGHMVRVQLTCTVDASRTLLPASAELHLRPQIRKQEITKFESKGS